MSRLSRKNRRPQEEELDAFLEQVGIPAIQSDVGAWMVETKEGSRWVTTDDPHRYRELGYTIIPLVRETEVGRVVREAVLSARRELLVRHAADLRLLAHMAHRLKTVLAEGYDYDLSKIRTDLIAWGVIEPASPKTGEPIDTAEGRRLGNVLELEWFETKVKWAADR